MTDKPTHPDGRPMRMGEMTPEQQREQLRAGCARIKAELEHPAAQEAIKRFLDGDLPT